MPPVAFTELTRAHLDRLTAQKQADDRIPGLAAGVARRGSLAWSAGVGTADLSRPGEPPDQDTQYDIASNTKTFVAVCVMALRDEGRLALDDTVDSLVPSTTHPGVTVRQLLAHVSGMQREPMGDVWDTLEFPDRAELVTGWNAAEQIGRPHSRHHYSNLGYAVLGEIVARLDGGDTWFDSVRQRVLEPLEMRRTTLGKSGRSAGAYYLPPFTDVPVLEPTLDTLAISAAGGLASTLTDLATWGGFLADPVAEVLSPDTVEEMCEPLTMFDASWTLAWGLGLMLFRRDGRTWVGHTGAHPGTISACVTHLDSGTTGIDLMNNTGARDEATFAIDLAAYAMEHEPEPVPPWVPGTSVPDELVPLLGQWWSEGQRFVLSVREGRLEARAGTDASDARPSVFAEVSTDVYRTVSGRERGELLRVSRDAENQVGWLNWATYRFTREPYAFGEWLRDP